MTRLLILTAGFGEGHNTAARAIAAACEAEHGPGSARIVDAFALTAPRLNALSRRGYIEAINRTPKLWSAFYAWLDRSRIVPQMRWLLRAEMELLARIVAEEKPTVVCSTYPVYAFIFEKLIRDGRVTVPHYNVVTDSISINSLWWRAGSEGWFVPNDDSRDVMLEAGLDPARLHVTGFPVTSFFSRHAREFTPPDLARGAQPRVLYIVHSGTKHAEETARRLLAMPDWDITCAVGRDDALRGKLTALAAGRARPALILGWTDQIPKLLMTHHAIVSKAGGATTQESIASRCPMIVNQVVPGQEEGNYELLRRHGVGALAETPDAVMAALQRAFADRGRVWSQWRAALDTIARPDAARDIVAHLLPPAPRHSASPLPAPASPALAAASTRSFAPEVTA